MAFTDLYISPAGSGTHTGLSAGNALTLPEAVTQNNLLGAAGAAARRYNAIKGAYSESASDVFSVGGTTTSPMFLRGYNSTIGDLDNGTRDAYGALDGSNYPVLTYASGNNRLRFATDACVVLMNFKHSNNYNGNGASFEMSMPCAVINCIFENTNTGSSANAAYANCSGIPFINCDVIGTAGATGDAIFGDSGFACKGCRVVGYGGNGFRASAFGTLDVTGCTVKVGGKGVVADDNNTVLNLRDSTVFGCGSDGVWVKSTSGKTHTIIGNQITDNGAGYGINFNGGTSGGVVNFHGNRMIRNGSGDVNGYTDWAAATARFITTSNAGASAEYTDPTTNFNFALLSAAPGYQQGFGFQSNVGACGSNITGGGGLLVHPGMTGGIRG